jgi:hypothetical protein
MQYPVGQDRLKTLVVKRTSDPCICLGRSQGFQEVEAPRISRQSAEEGDKVVILTYRPSLPPREDSLFYPEGSRRLRLLEFLGNRQRKAIRLSPLRTGRLNPPGKIPCSNLC